MSLRLKLVLALVALAASATIAIGLFTYRTTKEQLLGEIDRSLRESTEELLGAPGGPGFPGRTDDDRSLVRIEGDALIQVIDGSGDVRFARGVELPVRAADRTVAGAQRQVDLFRDEVVDDEPYRVLTSGLGRGSGAVQIARSLAETERVLAALRIRILGAAIVVVVVAAALGALIARQVTRRLVRLTAAAEHVTATGSLDVAVPVSGSDETGRLGSAFNDMLSALGRSKQAQQRLVQDAGHELRTPLTSLRTNVFALRRADELDPAQRARLLDDLQGETEELTRLIDEVVELATDRRSDEPEVAVDLGELVRRVAARAAARTGREVAVVADDSTVVGRPLALERAVGNLIENALKFDESDGPVDVTCAAGRVEVEDRGPGFAADDLPHVFDRFFRATSARSRPGSGLGLSIVHDVVAAHGGQVYAGNRPGGGAVVGFQLPPTTATSDGTTA